MPPGVLPGPALAAPPGGFPGLALAAVPACAAVVASAAASALASASACASAIATSSRVILVVHIFQAGERLIRGIADDAHLLALHVVDHLLLSDS